MFRVLSAALTLCAACPAFAEPGDAFESVAVAWGFEPIEKLALAEGEEEIRVWRTGYGVEGYVLSKRAGRWSFFHLADPEAEVAHARFGYRAAEIQPVCHVGDIIGTITALGVRGLGPPKKEPRCKTADGEPCLERVTLDGWSVHIRVKTPDTLQQWDYPNPGLPYFADPQADPKTYPTYTAAQIYQFLHYGIGGYRPQLFEPHSSVFHLPAIVLWRERDQGVVAYRIEAYDADGAEGVIRYRSLYFAETPQGFIAKPEQGAPPIELKWQGLAPYRIGMRDDERFRLFREGDLYRVQLSHHMPHERRRGDLAVVQNPDLERLDYVDLTSGFEAAPASHWDYPTCSRTRELKPAKRDASSARIDVRDAGVPAAWVVLPEALEKKPLVAVESVRRAHDFWVTGRQLDFTQPVSARIVVHPAPPGSDKPYWELLPQ
ncbi:MAG: hypothetical protein AAGA23_20020 [Pseudomonadota bacterium]